MSKKVEKIDKVVNKVKKVAKVTGAVAGAVACTGAFIIGLNVCGDPSLIAEANLFDVGKVIVS